MRKIICLLLIALSLFGLVACESTSTTSTPTAVAPVTTSPPPENSVEEPVLNTDTPYVLAENDDIYIVINGAPTINHYDASLNIDLENRTDKSLMFIIQEVSINNQPIDCFFSEMVAANQNKNATMNILIKELTENNIRRIETFAFTLRVCQAENLQEPDIFNKTYTNNDAINFMAVG